MQAVLMNSRKVSVFLSLFLSFSSHLSLFSIFIHLLIFICLLISLTHYFSLFSMTMAMCLCVLWCCVVLRVVVVVSCCLCARFVLALKTTLCVHSKRSRVCRQNARVTLDTVVLRAHSVLSVHTGASRADCLSLSLSLCSSLSLSSLLFSSLLFSSLVMFLFLSQ